MQIIFGTPSAVRLFVGDVRVTSVALGSSSENIRTSDNLRELFNRFEWTKNRLLKIPAEFRIPDFPAYLIILRRQTRGQNISNISS